MSLYKAIAHGKEHRKPYRRSKAFDASCRNHGGCPYCYDNRKFSDRRRRVAAEMDIREAERLADRAAALRGNTADKLYAISREPSPECPCPTEAISPMPPWFTELRASLFCIEQALNGIEDAVNRVEV